MKNFRLPRLFCVTLLATILLLINQASLAAGNGRSALKPILFELDPEWCISGVSPTATWYQEMPPARDNALEAENISALNIPSKALQHRLLKNIFQVNLPVNADPQHLLTTLREAHGVKWAEFAPESKTCGISNGIRSHVDAPPNDPYFPLQWSLDKISALPGWDISTGDTSVVIAIVDIGIDIDHNDLIHKRWINYTEYLGETNVDDDLNGFVDDVYGWDFYDDDADPRPSGTDSHGTHVAGIAAAESDNGYGITGVAWNCKIMPIRAGRNRSIYSGYEGVIYAVTMGADIINLSWGNNTQSNIERIASQYAHDAGSLIVAAAGNRTGSSAAFDHYPAGYPDVIAVVAVDTADQLATISNYNIWADISVPGVNIISSVPGPIGQEFSLASGTSMATPIVSGAAALLKSLHPDWSSDQIRTQLILTSDPIDNLNPGYEDSLGHGRLNLYRALADQIAGFGIEFQTITEGASSDHDGVVEPWEDAEIVFGIRNLLTQSAIVSGRITSDDHLLDMPAMPVQFGPIEPNQLIDNSSSPFTVEINAITPAGHTFNCVLHLDSGTGVTQSFPFNFSILPNMLTHSNGSVALTVTNFGAIGYYDYINEQSVGEGMRYPHNGLTSLFHGSLMVGSAPDMVSDCAFGDANYIRYDFKSSTPDFQLTTDDDGTQHSLCQFDDEDARRPLHIEVTQHTILYPEAPDDDYIIFDYNIRNAGLFAQESLRVALFLDWDVVQSTNNLCNWDAVNKLGWMQNTAAIYPVFGSAMLSGDPDFHVAINNSTDWPSGAWNKWSDEDKWELMNTGFTRASADVSDDYSQLLGTAPMTIPAGRSANVTFVILAGENAVDLAENLASARIKWAEFNNAQANSSGNPTEFRILSMYPQPFNGRMNIIIGNVDNSPISWSIFDLQGRIVQSGSSFGSAEGKYSLPLDFNVESSGKYLINIQQNQQHQTLPVTLIR